MAELRHFLDANKKDIVDFIESNQRPLAFPNNAFDKVLNELVRLLPMTKDGKTIVLDKAHLELAIAILEAMWCGWLSQAKANRGAYPKDFPDKFKEAIYNAFEIGQNYATTRA